VTTRKEDGRWFYRKWVRLPNGKKKRIFGTPRRYNLPNTRAGADEAERRAIQDAINGAQPRQAAVSSLGELALELFSPGSTSADKPRVPTVTAFAPVYLQHSRAKNKPRSVNSKEQILRDHILPEIGELPLDRVTFAVIEDLKHGLLESEYRGRKRSPKTVNNVLTVLRRLLVLAKKRGHIVAVPEFEWLHADDPDFDFLTFEEFDQLVAGADAGEWRTMIHIAGLTGLRQGEILALRWDEVDLERSRIHVVESTSRKITTSPKSRKGRTVEIGEIACSLLRAHRHLRGPFVFCGADGAQLTDGQCKWPLWRACRRAKLRRIGWHVLRHTYASHLAMLGASPKEIQEQLGHADLAMTMRYMHLAPASKAAAARLLDRPARILTDRGKSGGT